jgi:hypothetical protein
MKPAANATREEGDVAVAAMTSGGPAHPQEVPTRRVARTVTVRSFALVGRNVLARELSLGHVKPRH